MHTIRARPGHHPEIDGLRAIAVLAVMAYHASASFCPGGFLGVDIFFVISGYLIIGIIGREAASGTFTVAGFIDRRIRRILPELLVMAATTTIAVWWE